MHARRRITISAGSIVVAAALLLSACGDDKDDASSPSTNPEATTSSSSADGGSTTTTTAATKGPCPATTGAAIPAGMDSRVMGDLDGDGADDTLFVGMGTDGDRVFGVLTASGAISQWTVANASPIDPSIYGVADANEDGRLEVFVNPGRIVDVLTLSGCKLQPYLNKDGEPYGFSIGFQDAGTGVGCVDADGDGHRDLVGLLRKDETGGKVPWTRTIVTLQGTQARNGDTDSGTYAHPGDDAAIALLGKVTCGDDAFATPLAYTP